jgi:hypothetical protein
MKRIACLSFAVLCSTFCRTLSADADSASVPAAMIGTWAHGSCASAANRLVVTATTAALGATTPQPIVYEADDAGPGRGAIHFQGEGSVDNFVYVAQSKTIVHNAQGYHMPGQVVYKRCPAH